MMFFFYSIVTIGSAEGVPYLPGGDSMTQRESAVEHLRNAQQLARSLHDLLAEKDLQMLARDVAAIEGRIVRALDEMALGNLGRAVITSDGAYGVK